MFRGRFNHDDIKKEIEDFTSVLNTFRDHIPIEEVPDLVEDWEYFYERSIGCVGILKDWLLRALKRALAQDAKKMKIKHFEETALSVSACVKIASTAIEGEKRYLESENPEKLTNTLRRGRTVSGQQESEENNSDKPKTGSTPFQRNPTRDPVGCEVG